jgi:hypothetical protein
MASFKSRFDFILHITNYFHGHWEDPGWGNRASDQILIAVTIAELANRISDDKVKAQILDASDKVISKSARQTSAE